MLLSGLKGPLIKLQSLSAFSDDGEGGRGRRRGKGEGEGEGEGGNFESHG